MNPTLVLWSSSAGDVPITAQVLAAITDKAAPTSISTVGNGVLTAEALVSTLVNRSGPTGAFTDTTDTVANLIAAGAVAGSSFYTYIKNFTAFSDTLAAGTGVTIAPATSIIPANSIAEYLVAISADGLSATFTHTLTSTINTQPPEASVALVTVGAGVITGAGIATKLTARGGTQIAAFTDTTDTAVAIIAAMPNVRVGTSWEYTYRNDTIFPATLAAGVGVTLSGANVAQARSYVRYLVTYSAAGAITMEAIAQGYVPHSGTVTANGATPVPVTDANVTAGSQIQLTLKTVGGTPHGAFVSAVTPGTGFSINSLAGDTSTYNYEIRG